MDYSPFADYSLFSDYTLCSMYISTKAFTYYIHSKTELSKFLKIFLKSRFSARNMFENSSPVHIFSDSSASRYKKSPGIYPRTDDANEIRTRDTTVKGWCLNRLTMAPERGESRIRTGAQGVADPRLTTWLSRHKNFPKKQIGLRQASMS